MTGGFVYRGSAVPGLAGTYLFGDYCSGTIWGSPAAGDGPHEPRKLGGTNRRIVSFGEDEAGEVYLADLAGGTLARIVAGQ